MSIDLESTKKNKKEIDPQELRYRRRKDAIKNFAIIFLVVMLVLTFFSNTIMNYSLPQVAVQYMEAGSITTTIRGTGTVESGDPYNVIVKETRTVSSITARVGQEVRQGDILFSLSSEDSEELEAAKEELTLAQNAYDNLLLSADITASIISSSQANISVADYRAKITTAQNEVEKAQQEVDAAKEELEKINNQIELAGAAYISQADKDKLNNLETARDNAKDAWDALGVMTNPETTLQGKVDTANALKEDEKTKKAAYDARVADIAEKQAAATAAQEALDNLVNPTSEEYDAAVAARDAANTALTDAQNATPSVSDLGQAYTDSVTATTNANAEVENYKNSDEYKKYIAYKNAEKEYTDFKNNINSRNSANSDTLSSLEAQKATAQVNLNQANDKLTEKTEALGELIGDITLVRQLNDAHDKIVDAQKKVDKLTTSSAAMDITAPINGTILNVYIISGKQTAAGEAAVVIQPEGQGYTMSFSVSNNEAKTISIGAAASVANSWWYNDVTGTVESIRPDTASPNTNKLVTLNLSGSLVVGQTLTMSIDSRTSNYDSIVPNSAIHEDNNGKFILVVQSKPSPLGNRYFAVRYDVQVLASDDTKSAVKAGLEGYEYVITTSSKPISAGDQVRLSEN